jgi:two-component system sensor kinase FixL
MDQGCAAGFSVNEPWQRVMLAFGRAAQVIITARDDADFYNRVCRAIVLDPMVVSAAIGFARGALDAGLEIIATAGLETPAAMFHDLSAQDLDRRDCPVAKALRDGKARIRNFPTAMIQDGVAKAAIVIPIQRDAGEQGALTITMATALTFSNDESRAFQSQCHGLASGIAFYRLREKSGPMRARLAAIVESSSDAIISVTLDGIIISWNGGAESIYGYTADEAIGRSISFLAPVRRKAEIANLNRRVINGEHVTHCETKRVAKDGRTLDISLTLSPIRDHGGAIVGISIIAQDVTSRLATERQVRELTAEIIHLSRLREVGQFAAFVAHELNQPLSALMNYLEAARYAFAAAKGATKSQQLGLDLLERASGQTERAAEIIRRLRGLVEKRPVERASHQLCNVVEDACALALIGANVDNIEIETDFDEGLPPINVDKIQIQQVVVNLVRNAVDVLKKAPRRLLKIEVHADPDGLQHVLVTDSGPGVSPEVADRLFQPFATSKADGMGLGLSISHSIIESHGGSIWHEPNPDGGARFRFSLPAG